MYANERTRILSAWIEPSSSSEQDRQDRALRMVQTAIDAHPAFRGVGLSVYAKGSYPNNTNVRLDSDVDIVVECTECQYYDYHQISAPLQPPGSPYHGQWTPALWRAEIERALVNRFGASEVDASGEVAIRVREKPGSRPSADIVPSFDFRLYLDQARRAYEDGSVVYKRNGTRIVNWPDQQLVNGREKNSRTGRRYKNFVRALKNAENELCRQKVLPALPSYLMECLVYNVRDYTLSSGGLGDSFEATLLELKTGLIGRLMRSGLSRTESSFCSTLCRSGVSTMLSTWS